MKYVLTIIFLLFSSYASATTYFVDSVGGLDTNSGTAIGSPWQTVGKVNTLLASGLNPGDSVLFKNGDTWNSGLPITFIAGKDNGNSTSQVTVGTYGTGAKPIFDGIGTQTACTFGNGGDGGASATFAYITVTGIECKNTTQYGIYFHNFIPVPSTSWIANTATVVGDFIFPVKTVNAGKYLFKTTTAGTSAAVTQPTWCQTVGCTVTDGTAVRTNMGKPFGMPGIIISNNLVHSTGPGAFTGATQGPNGAAGVCAAGPPNGPCDDLNYRNQIMFLDEGGGIDNVQILNNDAHHCGGHNCYQIQGDSGSASAIGNTCYDWQHNCMDTKNTQNALYQSNTVTGPSFACGAGLYYENDALTVNNPYVSFVSATTITYQLNLVYNTCGSLQCENSNLTQGLLTCKAYYNTLDPGTAGVTTIASSSNSPLNWIIEGNIMNSNSPIFVCGATNTNSCGQIVTWDYNDDGGTTGAPSPALVVQGPHDLVGANPQFVNKAAQNYNLLPNSPCINAAPLNLIGGHNDMGAFEAVPGASTTGNSASILLF